MTTLICHCNRTMPLDGRALSAALGEPLPVYGALCRHDAGAFLQALKNDDSAPLVVACTQEKRLFAELASETFGARGEVDAVPLRFVNIRETAGWSREAGAATPKIAALLALARLPEPEPVPTVSYRSGGALLIVGPAEAALQWAERIAAADGTLRPAVLITEGVAPLSRRDFPVWSGRIERLSGHLGAFDIDWNQTNPIDLDVCTRCGACVASCPEQAIGAGLQIDLARCNGHRDCVAACGAVGAIDFERIATPRSERFDLVLDLSRQPLLRMTQPPQGYRAPGADPLDQALAAADLAQLVGEFDKPKFFDYRERLCAHGRNGKIGCHACLDVCSTQAIRSEFHDGRGAVKVDANLCMGCGACSTVCPSGAMAYGYPKIDSLGWRLETLLKAYGAAGGRDAVVLLHAAGSGAALIDALGRAAQQAKKNGKGPAGVPARVLPLPLFHIASAGLEAWFGALAFGAAQIALLLTGDEAPEYRAALRHQIEIGNAILGGLGHGERLRLIEADDAAALDAALAALPGLAAVAPAAAFHLPADKREALDFSFDHLSAHAGRSTAPSGIALPARAPFGTLQVDGARCTLCMSCVGACPENALRDHPEQPQLSFIERNCVQCGLCVSTCPEQAIVLQPRLLLTPERRQPVVLNGAQPFHCTRCGKPFGTLQMIETMLGKLGAHPAFSGAAAVRLKMCSDCRVAHMIEHSSTS